MYCKKIMVKIHFIHFAETLQCCARYLKGVLLPFSLSHSSSHLPLQCVHTTILQK